VPAVDFCGKGKHLALTKIRPHANSLIRELELDTVEFETLCCVQKLYEMWKGRHDLIEELNCQLFKARGGDPTNNRFQVRANAAKMKQAEVRKCNGCRHWRVRELPLGPLHIKERERERDWNLDQKHL